MEIAAYIFIGLIIGAVIAYLILGQKITSLQSNLESNSVIARNENTFLRSEYERVIAEKISSESTIDKNNEKFQTQKTEFIDIITSLKEQNASLKAKSQSLYEQLENQKLQDAKNEEKIKTVFENIANKILDEKQEKFSKIGSKEIRDILDPLGKEIKEFKDQIEKNNLSEAEKRASLSTELKQLMSLNKQLSDDASNLTKALKGEKNSKVQGDWGEMILESILTNSGLEKDRHYFTQLNQKSADGTNQRPDVIIRYPDGREIIIDSKVSLTAYSRYVNCNNDDDREKALNEHINSIKKHIDELCDKEYERRDESLDFVMMFMPIETAYMIAFGKDNSLWDYAYKKRIILVTPTHLITALKLVYDLWKREMQNQNVKKIVERGVLMYEKFNGFVVEMEEIDNSLNKCRVSYDKAMDRLKNGKGNLISQAKELQNLGIKSAKAVRINQINNAEEL